MSFNIVTIGREFGSAGRAIGNSLAEKLGVPCYDSEIIEKVASESGFAKEYVAEKGEYAQGGVFAGSVRNNYFNMANEDRIWAIQSNFIKELADKGPCVIVGRCADYILRDRDDVLRVFIRSDLKSRARRIVEIYGESGESVDKRLKKMDKCRASYYHYYTDMKWGDASNYDIVLHSGNLGIDKCVDLLCEAVRNG